MLRRRHAHRLPVLAGLFVLILVLAGCSDLAQLLPQEAEESLPSAFVEPTPASVYPPQMATAARILSRGELVVGVRYDLEPFSYVTAGSELSGLEVDLARELARRWLGSSEAVRFRQVRSDTAFQHLAEGEVDIVMAGLVHTQDAEARADFSPPYFTEGMALLTLPTTGIQGLGDLQDRTIGVLESTDAQAQVAASSPISVTYAAYDDFFAVTDALRTGEIAAYADQRHRLERARTLVTGSIIVGQWTSAPVSLIYREDDPFFADLVWLTFQDMAADGTRDALYDRWLAGTSPPALTFLPGDVVTPPLDQTPQQISDLDVIARIAQRGSLAVGYFQDRWPYSADRADGGPTGFEIRLLEAIAEMWLGSADAITFVPVVNEAEALQRLANGEVDVLAGNFVHTRENELRADFTIPILDDGVGIFSLAANPISELQQLSGQPVGVVVGSDGEQAVPRLSQGIGLSAQGYPDFGAAVAALQEGEVMAILTERRPALNVHFQETGYAFTDQRYSYRPVAFVLPEGDSDYRDLFNLTLMALETQGVYQETYGVWFDDPAPGLVAWPGTPAVSLVITQ